MAAPLARMVFKGDKEMLRAMNRLKGGAQRRIARPAVTAGLKPIRKAARENVPVEHGLLKKSLGSIILKKSKTKVPGAVVGIIGPRSGFRQVIDGKPRDPAKYGHLVEFGTEEHTIKPRPPKKALSIDGKARAIVDHPGTTGSRFLTRAFDSKKVVAQTAFTAKARTQLAKEVARARRRK